eukprot:845997_1
MSTLSTPTEHSENLIPLIEVCRKLECCDRSQFLRWFSAFPQIFDEYKAMNTLKKILQTALCDHHTSISEATWIVLKSLLSTDDSIDLSQNIGDNKVDENDDDYKSFTLLKISKDLKVAIFSFLNVTDLIRIRNTCRCLLSHTGNITSLISICRKLESFNQSQFSQFFRAFSEHKHVDIFMKILQPTLCGHYASIPNAIWKDLKSLLPTDKELQILDDSITKSDPQNGEDENEDDFEPLTLLKIPKDLMLVIFNFLKQKDLLRIQKTCRCLLVHARNPNALYHLRILTFSHHYLKPVFSRIKSLSFTFNQHNAFNNTWIAWCKTLTILSLRHCILNDDLLNALVCCVNLQQLLLTIKGNEVSMFDYKKINPFKKLNWFHFGFDSFEGIDHTDANCAMISKTVNWILSNKCEKTLVICLNDGTGREIFFNSSEMTALVLRNVKTLKLDVNSGNNTMILCNNICKSLPNINTKLDELDITLESWRSNIDTRYGTLSNELLDSISSILPYFNRSTLNLTLYMDHNYTDEETELNPVFLRKWNPWMTKIMQSNLKFVDELDIQLCFYPMEEWGMNTHIIDDFLAYNGMFFNEPILKQRASDFGMEIMDNCNEWFKPFLKINKEMMEQKGMKSVRVRFKTHFGMDELDERIKSHYKHCDFDKAKCTVQSAWNGVFYPCLQTYIEKQLKGINDDEEDLDCEHSQCFPGGIWSICAIYGGECDFSLRTDELEIEFQITL